MADVARRHTAVIHIGDAELFALANLAAFIFANAPRVDTCTINANLMTLTARFTSTDRQTLAIDAFFAFITCRITCRTYFDTCRMKTHFAFVRIACR